MSLMLKAARGGRTGMAVGMSRRRVIRGDPGLFGFLGKVGKAAIGGALGFATGGVGGALTGIRGGLATRPAMPGTGFVGPQQIPPPPIGPSVSVPFPGAGQLRIDPLAALPGGAPLFTRTNGQGTPAGYHLNKSAYFLKDGTFVPARSRFVKNRTRNPLNPRALRRAVGRIEAGKIWQSKLGEITTAKFTAAGNRK